MESIDTVNSQDHLAERIAAVLRERKKIGAQRRSRQLEMQLRNSQRAAARYHAARAPHDARLNSVPHELREHCDRRMKTVDAAYQAVTAANAADTAFGQ